MTAARRALGLCAALAAMWAGLGVLASRPLPQRVDFSGTWDAESYTAPEVGAQAPPIVLEMLDGGQFSLTEVRGQPVVLNFWATWCAPCEAELPELQALAQARPDVRVAAINAGEPPEQVRSWLAARGLRLPVLMDPDGRAAAVYQIRGQPSTFVIGVDGTILSVMLGATTRAQVEQVLGPDA